MKIEKFHDFFCGTINISPNLTLVQVIRPIAKHTIHWIWSILEVKMNMLPQKNMKKMKKWKITIFCA